MSDLDSKARRTQVPTDEFWKTLERIKKNKEKEGNNIKEYGRNKES